MTMIYLTAEQALAIAGSTEQPPMALDPRTNKAYVLLQADEYERARPLLEPPAPEPSVQIAPLMLQSMKAFWRELPELLKQKSTSRLWVGFHANERVCFGPDDLDVYQECFRRGLQRGEFYVAKIEADPEGIPPWGTIQADQSLYEFTECAEHF
jgi:hypothetical protein